ncbi:hypothetical protein JDV02_007380 [Purpureocillium takamizusanense]|uniref:Zeta toxin domain-containing protein n=1 Tax=Purpureocillium takamizusanense TaxID=2060973 RepID=A0A9Q8QKJ9_9HYPO|nr:uncharacterized protein JDV02_007380 [Purpureocillium takamizusanense]UNI21385.1 hypothetical protein JDV02_007380 [Purpureocillium takamizusanense]
MPPPHPPPEDLSAYRLPDDEALRIFNEEILPAELPPPPPTDDNTASDDGGDDARPLALLVVGQTGAGKTILSQALLAALQRCRRRDASASGSASAGPVAHLIADTYKTYHPQYTRLMLSTPHLASPATGPDARRWLALAARHVARRRLDVLLESACRHPDDFVQLARLFREDTDADTDADAGRHYRVEVVVLAVPAPLSRLGILLRFYEKLPEGQSRNLPVRLTPRKVHDDSYQGLLHAAAFLDGDGDGDGNGDAESGSGSSNRPPRRRRPVADQVLVVRRGNLVVARRPDATGVAEALRVERERPLTPAEMKTALDDVQKLSTHEDAKEQLDEVRAMLQPLLNAPSPGGAAGHFPELLPLQFATDGGTTDDGQNVLRLGKV